MTTETETTATTFTRTFHRHTAFDGMPEFSIVIETYAGETKFSHFYGNHRTYMYETYTEALEAVYAVIAAERGGN